MKLPVPWIITLVGFALCAGIAFVSRYTGADFRGAAVFIALVAAWEFYIRDAPHKVFEGPIDLELLTPAYVIFGLLFANLGAVLAFRARVWDASGAPLDVFAVYFFVMGLAFLARNPVRYLFRFLKAK